MVVIEVNNTDGRILSALTLDQITVISQMCSFQVEASEFKQNAFRKHNAGNQWDGFRRLFHSGRQTFPIGLLPRIMGLFHTCGIPVNLIDKRVHMDRQFNLPCIPREHRQYQYDIMMSSILNGGGIVKAATGSGKTTMGALTTSALGKPSVFIVHTKDLLYQAKESFEKLHGCEIGQIGDGIIDPKQITVATVQTLSKAADIFYTNYKYDEDAGDDEDSRIELTQDKKMQILQWARTVGIVQFDEVQRVASRTAYDVRFMFRNADNAFGYSASPWRDDGADLMIEAAFGPIICDVSASQLIREGWLIRPDITVKRVNTNVWDGASYGTIYRTAVVENMFRNMQVVQDAEEHFLANRCTLVLVTQIKHGETIEVMLRSSGIPAQFISGKSKTRYRKQVIEDMRRGEAPVVIATTIADVGLDVPRISAIVEAGAGKSSVTALQRVGRGTRKFPGKSEFLYTTYRDVAPIICNHIDNKIKIWRTEPEFIIREV